MERSSKIKSILGINENIWAIIQRYIIRVEIVPIPSKHEALAQRWFTVGPSSTTLAQQQTNVGPTSQVCWVATVLGIQA